VVTVCKRLGITAAARWRNEHGGMKVDQAKWLKALEREGGRLKRLLAGAARDEAILKEAVKGNF
jgi:putative transposase